MRVVTLELLLRRIIDTIDRGITEHLPTPYLRSQAIAMVSLLTNLAERAEEKASLLHLRNQEMRAILEETLGLISGVGETEATEPIAEALKAAYPSLAEEHAALRRALYRAVETLYHQGSSLDADRLNALRGRIRAHLRRQLDQDIAIYHPVRAGRMFRGG